MKPTLEGSADYMGEILYHSAPGGTKRSGFPKLLVDTLNSALRSSTATTFFLAF